MHLTSNVLYFDTAATTQIAPEVLDKMVQHLGSEQLFANPSSVSHVAGQLAAKVVDEARVPLGVSVGEVFAIHLRAQVDRN